MMSIIPSFDAGQSLSLAKTAGFAGTFRIVAQDTKQRHCLKKETAPRAMQIFPAVR
jgi:hypothetical protein